MVSIFLISSISSLVILSDSDAPVLTCMLTAPELILLIRSTTKSLPPLPTVIIAITDATPIIMPSMVRIERIIFVRILNTAILMFSQILTCLPPRVRFYQHYEL